MSLGGNRPLVLYMAKRVRNKSSPAGPNKHPRGLALFSALTHSSSKTGKRNLLVTPLYPTSKGRAAAVSTKVVCAAAKSWMPGSKHPAHLNGSLVGDFGFDPLGLGKKPQDLAWYVQAELVHARFAMLGAAGIMIPEALTKMGVLNTPHWYDAGAMDIGWTNFTTLAFAQVHLQCDRSASPRSKVHAGNNEIFDAVFVLGHTFIQKPLASKSMNITIGRMKFTSIVCVRLELVK
eukprot:1179730-Prorocentrum_minimum.AAC.7